MTDAITLCDQVRKNLPCVLPAGHVDNEGTRHHDHYGNQWGLDRDLLGKIVRDTTVDDDDLMYLVGETGFMSLGAGVFLPYDSAFPGPEYFDRPEFVDVPIPS